MRGGVYSVHTCFTFVFFRNLSVRHAGLLQPVAHCLPLRTACRQPLGNSAHPRFPMASLSRESCMTPSQSCLGRLGASIHSVMPGSHREFFSSALCMGKSLDTTPGSSKKKGKTLTLDKMLQQQGFGTRRDCAKLVEAGVVALGGEDAEDPSAKIVVYDGLEFQVGEEIYEYREKVYVMLHKPDGYECTSASDGHHPPVFDLLPYQMLDRGVQCVGRLDVDTTGLLLLTDDGSFSHLLRSPKKNKSKVYIVKCKHKVEESIIDQLLAGVRLKDAPDELIKAAGAEIMSEKEIRLTITEGKYHQVKRMIAASGNRVEGLHRDSIGALRLPVDLPVGEWRYLTPEEVAAVTKGES